MNNFTEEIWKLEVSKINPHIAIMYDFLFYVVPKKGLFVILRYA